MLKPATIVSELSVIMFGFAIYEMIYGSWKAGTGMGPEKSFDFQRAALTLVVIFCVVTSVTFISSANNSQITYQKLKKFGVIMGFGNPWPLSVVCFIVVESIGYFGMGLRQAFLFFTGYLLALIAIRLERNFEKTELWVEEVKSKYK